MYGSSGTHCACFLGELTPSALDVVFVVMKKMRTSPINSARPGRQRGRVTETFVDFFSIRPHKSRPDFWLFFFPSVPTKMWGVMYHTTRVCSNCSLLEVWTVYSTWYSTRFTDTDPFHHFIGASKLATLTPYVRLAALFSRCFFNPFPIPRFYRCARFRSSKAGYLFPGIAKRRNAYLEANPDCRNIISLGIGDTTQVKHNHYFTST